MSSFDIEKHKWLDLRRVTQPILRADHYERLSRKSQGYLRDLTISLGNFFTTYNKLDILDIYTDHNIGLQFNEGINAYADTLAIPGCMVIPYIPQKGTNRVWSRLRTSIIPKYLSPLGKFNPPYIPTVYSNTAYIDKYIETLIQEVKGEVKLQFEDVILTDLLKGLGICEDLCWPQEGNLPIVVVEGEFKALSILEALLEQYKRAMLEFIHGEPLTPIYHFQVVGIVGVWGMLEKYMGAYQLRSEWVRGLFGESIRARDFYICFDSDSEYKIEVAHAASHTINVLQNIGCDAKYVTIPSSSKEHKLGADDFMIEEGQKMGYHNAGLKFIELLENSEHIYAGIQFSELAKATREGYSAIAYLKSKYREQLIQTLTN